jgi:hypothetical protein
MHTTLGLGFVEPLSCNAKAGVAGTKLLGGGLVKLHGELSRFAGAGPVYCCLSASLCVFPLVSTRNRHAAQLRAHLKEEGALRVELHGEYELRLAETQRLAERKQYTPIEANPNSQAANAAV